MGANISGAMVDGAEGGSPLKPRLGDIPESCAALVLALLDPPEICKLARVNRSFHGASSADFIWESKLPSNYRFIVEKVLRDTALLNLQKKQLYARLCRPNPFDAGRKVNIFSQLFFYFPCLSPPVFFYVLLSLDSYSIGRRYG